MKKNDKLNDRKLDAILCHLYDELLEYVYLADYNHFITTEIKK